MKEKITKKGPTLKAEPAKWGKNWRRPTLAQPIDALPSALWRFTSVFGMGTGGTTTLRSPDYNEERIGNL